MAVLLTFLSGFAVLLSIIVLGQLNRYLDKTTTLLVHIGSSVLFSLLFSLVLSDFHFTALQTVPPYLYIGAVLVIAVSLLNGIIINKVPAVYASVLFFIGQLFTSIFIDAVKLHTLPIGDLAGGLLILAGLAYNSRVDLKQALSVEGSAVMAE